jgi:serine/threonine protein kinase
MAGDLEVGSRFAGYRVDGLLARGGMGAVYRASGPESDRTVALKLISPEFADDIQFRRRFEREARLAAELDHPNVIPLISSGEFEGVLFIATQLIEGLNLHEIVTVEGPLSPRGAGRVIAQVASALDAAHDRGLLHRDVKSANVILEGAPENGTAYLTDFGLSKHVLSKSGLTRPGRWVGTIDYAAPEQLQALDVDHRVDVYALGCVLFEALTGEVPFSRPREVQKMIAHISEAPPAVSRLRPDAVAFDGVVRRAMEKDPDDRYSSAGDLGDAALQAAAASPEPIAGERPASDTGASQLPRDQPAPAGDAPTAA